MIHSKHFTIKEAKELLSEIKLQLFRIVKLKDSLNKSGYDIHRHQYFGGMGPNGTGKYPADLEELIKSVDEIIKRGIIIKGIDNGLIDFPHIRENGEEVYLCYLSGENDLEFWHGINDGFMGRKSIEDL
ncbi:MAG: DUF2203 family protein [Ignavibacteria bacterium]